MTERAPRPWALLLGGALLLCGGVARAEPHFSLRSGLRCSRCHTSPHGGGKRTPYGALYAMTALPLAAAPPQNAPPGPGGGPPGGATLTTLATGEVTSWLAVGADLRLDNVTTFDADEVQNSFRASAGRLYLALRPWPERLLLYLDTELGGAGLRNREAWALIRGPWGLSLRGGNLLPPFGLRLLDDGALPRRVSGVSFANPDLGLELGFELGPLQAAFALTNGSFSGEDNDALKALWAQVVLQLSRLRLGISGAYNPSEAGCRAMGALHGGVGLGRLGLLAEVDLLALRPADSARWTTRLALLLELDLHLWRGVSLRGGYEFASADLTLEQQRRQRFRVGLDIFPLRMVEVKLSYVAQQAESPLAGEDADLLEVSLHVFL